MGDLSGERLNIVQSEYDVKYLFTAIYCGRYLGLHELSIDFECHQIKIVIFQWFTIFVWIYKFQNII